MKQSKTDSLRVPVFDSPEFIGIDSRFEVAGTTLTPPSEWNGSIRVIEEVTETLMALNLPAATGLPLVLFRRAWPMDPSADLIASDPLGRVHLFELKKGSFGVQETSQLEQYLLRHIFDDPQAFLEEQRVGGFRQLDPAFTARFLSGALSNERIGPIGPGWIVKRLGADHPMAMTQKSQPLTKYRWGKLDIRQRAERIHAASVVRATSKELPGPFPGFAEVLALSDGLTARLGADLRAWSSRMATSPPLVIWLVGRIVQPGALERVRLWRRSGVDARVLRIETRRHPGGWTMQVRREEAAARDRLEERLFTSGVLDGADRVKLSVYDTPSASTGKRHGGGLLEEPSATICRSDGARETVTV